MLILKIILILIAAFFLCAAIQGIIRANRMTPEEQAAFLQDYKAQRQKRKTKKKTYAPRKDPNTTILRNIYWLTFFNTFFKKK